MEEEDLEPSEEVDEVEEEEFDPVAERQRIRAELETEFQGHKTEYAAAEARRTNQRLRDTAGIEIDEKGNLRPVDAVRATQFAAQAVGKEPDVNPLDEPVTIYDDQDTARAKQVHQRKTLIAELREEFRREMEPLRELAIRPSLNGVPTMAREALKAYGVDERYADHQDFANTITAAMQQAVTNGGLAPGAMSDPQTVASFTLMLLPTLPKPEGGTPARERDATGRYLQQAQRDSLRSTGPSRGTAGNGTTQVALDDGDRAMMASLDIKDEAEYRAYARSVNERDPDLYTDYLNKKRQKAAAGGRR